MFQAWPISKNWYPDEPGITIDEFSMYIALACTELVLDVVVLALPWPVVWRLHMDTSRKWRVSGMFTLGGLWVRICTCYLQMCWLGLQKRMRCECFPHLLLPHNSHFSKPRFYMYAPLNSFARSYWWHCWLILEDDTYDIFIWTVIEPCTGVVCACLPTLGPLFQGNHSMESFIGSIRNYLRIDSQNQNSKSSVNHQISDDAIVLTSIDARHLDDVESHNFVEEGIYVQTKLSKSETERHTSEV